MVFTMEAVASLTCITQLLQPLLHTENAQAKLRHLAVKTRYRWQRCSQIARGKDVDVRNQPDAAA